MSIELAPFAEQSQHWPREGRCILAQHDAETIVVYQAYCPYIAKEAAKQQRFGRGFSFNRMSWIKPNFLWMMFRSGWGTKTNQEVTLAIRLPRAFFDALLGAAVPSSFDPDLFETREAWKSAVEPSEVRLQWDPDHAPDGSKLARRAIQLGLRGETLRIFATEAVIGIVDLSQEVARQRTHLAQGGEAALETPRETVYRPEPEATRTRLRLDAFQSSAASAERERH